MTANPALNLTRHVGASRLPVRRGAKRKGSGQKKGVGSHCFAGESEILAVRVVLNGNRCQGNFVYGRRMEEW